jgi:DNA mismatch endonuclease (patch repair protein)
MDRLNPEQRRRTMRAVRSSRTSLEDQLAHELWTRGFRYRRNQVGLFGRPDFSNQRRRLVVFVDSCFWHGCPVHYRAPTSNVQYWSEKLERNRMRDSAVDAYYAGRGWTSIRVWEHDLKLDPGREAEQVIERAGARP